MELENQSEKLSPVESDFVENARRKTTLKLILNQMNLEQFTLPEGGIEALKRLCEELDDKSRDYDLDSTRRVNLLQEAGLQKTGFETEPAPASDETEFYKPINIELNDQVAAHIRGIVASIESEVENRDLRYKAPESFDVPDMHSCMIEMFNAVLKGGPVQAEQVAESLLAKYRHIDSVVFYNAWIRTEATLKNLTS